MTALHPPLFTPGGARQPRPTHSHRRLYLLLAVLAVALVAAAAFVAFRGNGSQATVGPGTDDQAAAAPAQSAGGQPAVASTTPAAAASPSRGDPAPAQAADRGCKLVTAQEAGQAGAFSPVAGVSDSQVLPKSATTPDGVIRQCRYGAETGSNVTVGADVFPNATAALTAYDKWNDLFGRTLTNAPVDVPMSGAIGPKGKAMLTQDDITPRAAVFFVEGPVLVRITVTTPGASQAPVAGAKNLAVIAASRVPELVKA